MRNKIIVVVVFMLLLISSTAVVVAWNFKSYQKQNNTNEPLERDYLEYGDAPEGTNHVAYPATGVTGAFPTCMGCGPASWIQHNNFGAWFGPAFDFEMEGNAGWCPRFQDGLALVLEIQVK
ncbi:MAG: hypothetical protein NTX92_09335 [Euryarchaeota archaeon]|nr:hypothetical protein [Euryarchaeota archaeon]